MIIVYSIDVPFTQGTYSTIGNGIQRTMLLKKDYIEHDDSMIRIID